MTLARPFRPPKCRRKTSRFVRVDDRRMYVALATDRPSVPKPRRHDVDGLHDSLACNALVPC